MRERLTAATKRLAVARDRRRRAALGPPLQPLSDGDLGVLTNVGPTDQAEAQAFVRAVAGQRGVDMLEAG